MQAAWGQAVVWRDFLCPWCHLGRDRTALLRELGVTVTPRAYDLHPEVPLEGRAVRPGGRLAALFDRIAEQCAEVGLAFRAPTRLPNTRRALEAVEVVAAQFPEALAVVDDGCYAVVWEQGGDLGDPAVLDGVLAAADVDPGTVGAALAAGEGAALVAASMAAAREHDVTGTPAWWVADRLLVPGVQERDTLIRWVRRLAERP